MKVFLAKDVPKVGMAGEIIKVSDGFAKNFIFPNKLGLLITADNESFYQNRIKTIEHRKEVVASHTSMLAEKINSLTVIIKKKMHDNDKAYGAVSAAEVVEGLAEKGISIRKSQVDFIKAIKTAGMHKVIIQLSSLLQPSLTIKVVPQTVE